MKLLRRLFKTLTALALCAFLLWNYMLHIEPRWVQIKELELPAPGVAGSVRIAAFGDVHIGMGKYQEDLQTLVEDINGLQPDVVLFLGDLFDDYSTFEGDADACLDILAGIEADHKYAVRGNHDVGGGAQFLYPDWIERMGFVLLEDEAAPLETGINIIGAADSIYFNPDFAGQITDGFDLLVSHEPDAGAGLGQIELQLSGHSHGGQVWVPFLLEDILPKGCARGYRGLYEKPEGGALYVNRGWGMSLLPVRLLSRPEITLLTLKGDR